MAVNQAISRALISVSDKAGIVDFCRQLSGLGVEIISTGGTAQWLLDHDIPTIEVSEITGYPELMDGRVKTLHPKVHAALLARERDGDALLAHDIRPIDLLVVNLYPFSETVAKENCSLEQAIDNIDIGGPAMLRAAAKNYQRLTVVSDQRDYQSIINEMTENKGSVSEKTRYKLAQKVFKLTAEYDAAINEYISNNIAKVEINGTESRQLKQGGYGSFDTNTNLPEIINLELHKKDELRYGENPHQRAALYVVKNDKNNVQMSTKQLQGKALSFNNIVDAHSALDCVKSFINTDACVIVKHANPCGVACSRDQKSAYEAAFACDPISAFGGVIAFNQLLTEETAKKILSNQFVEVLIAPGVSAKAAEVFLKKPTLRLLSYEDSNSLQNQGWDIKKIGDGYLIQDLDIQALNMDELQIVTQKRPSEEQMRDLQFAWRVVKYVKSNAIVYAKNQRTLGIGAGQMSRVDSARIAALKANEAKLDLQGSVMASDAFFPFQDAIETAIELGVSAIIQPGGSVRDQEIIAAADSANIAMVFTGVRHFRH